MFEKFCFFIFHDYVIRSVRNIRHFNRDCNIPYKEETAILYVCMKCRKIKRKNVDGKWTKEELEIPKKENHACKIHIIKNNNTI